MDPSVDTYRALARSSPWRWRTLHFTRLGGRVGDVEAWVRRPGELVVRLASGAQHYVSGAPYAVSRPMVASSPDAPAVVDGQDAAVRERRPTFRPDGLVETRPTGYHLEHGDPMWQDYTWTAMLDPEELSAHVSVTDVRRDDRAGRETWVARLTALPGYEPRCGCCPLLWSEVAAAAEYADEPDRLAAFAAEGYPEAHVVALDVGTGVVVSLEPVGGGRDDLGFTVEIHEVDADLDPAFAP